MKYKKWGNFSKVIDRTKLDCNNSALKIQDDFPDVRKMVEKGTFSTYLNEESDD